MIVFELICPEDHRFEGWFSSADDFDSQWERGLLSCPSCGHGGVRKLPTAKVRISEGRDVPSSENLPAPMGAQVPVATMPQVSMNQLIDFVLRNSEDVGKSFADEARKIHREESPPRSIRGVATRAETESLLEDGIPVMPLPIPAKEEWH